MINEYRMLYMGRYKFILSNWIGMQGVRGLLDVKSEIQRLKKERNAVILAHNYQLDEVQEVADYRQHYA